METENIWIERNQRNISCYRIRISGEYEVVVVDSVVFGTSATSLLVLVLLDGLRDNQQEDGICWASNHSFFLLLLGIQLLGFASEP
jgi:hypothetical protein